MTKWERRSDGWYLELPNGARLVTHRHIYEEPHVAKASLYNSDFSVNLNKEQPTDLDAARPLAVNYAIGHLRVLLDALLEARSNNAHSFATGKPVLQKTAPKKKKGRKK